MQQDGEVRIGGVGRGADHLDVAVHVGGVYRGLEAGWSKLLGSVGDGSEVVKAVVKQIGHVSLQRVSTAAGAVERHTDQPDAVPLRHCNSGVVALGGHAGLHAQNAAVVVVTGGEHHALVAAAAPVSRQRLLVGRVHRIFGLSKILQEVWRGQRVAGDQRHVVGGGIVVVIVQPVWIDKVGVDAAQVLHLFVHHLHKTGGIAGGAVLQRHRSVGQLGGTVGQGVGGIICGLDGGRVQQVADVDHLILGDGDIGAVAEAVGFRIGWEDILGGDGVGRFRVHIFQRQSGG